MADDDCDDNNPTVFPGANDSVCDGIDNNCDGVVPANEADGDGDGLVTRDEFLRMLQPTSRHE